MRAHKDDIMRNAAQGSDLWFQVEDYNGSRVLLRTSLMRGTTGSKQCRQMAADVAAKYSVWGEEHYSIPVMYTDSRKVAKRGSKFGSMKKNKSLGRIREDHPTISKRIPDGIKSQSCATCIQ